jgi:SAM-dependent methyltransferase
MSPHSLRPFEDPGRHEAVSGMLRRLSTNRTDVREVLLAGLDLGDVRAALELGCGFGFMSEALAGRLHPAAHLAGVDACAANGPRFLARLEVAGRAASFQCARLADRLAWPDASLDLVLCSWSLYFFPRILPEIARVLRPGGLALAVTHSERAFAGLLEAAGLAARERESEALLRRFSAENGARLLAPHFATVARVDYPNRLRFGPADETALLAYLAFKLPVLLAEPPPGPGLPAEIEAAVRRTLAGQGEVWVEKDDACFRCWKAR